MAMCVVTKEVFELQYHGKDQLLVGWGIKLKAGRKVRGLVGPMTSRITLSERRVTPAR